MSGDRPQCYGAPVTHIEDLQRAALQELDAALTRQREADADVIAAAAKCNDVGVSIERIRAMGGVGRGKVYRWLRDAPPRADQGTPAAAAPSMRGPRAKRNT